MASIHGQALQAARRYANLAVMVAEKLEPETYDSVGFDLDPSGITTPPPVGDDKNPSR
jgi:hypothetical protein